MKDRVVYWPLYTLLVTFLITGLLFKFNYFHEVDIQLHDTYLVVWPLHFGVLFWILITFMIFLARGLKRKFSDKTSTWILLIFNSLLLVLLLLITYTIYAFLGSYTTVDLFRSQEVVDKIPRTLSKVLNVCAGVVTLILSGELFLIRRLLKFRTVKHVKN